MLSLLILFAFVNQIDSQSILPAEAVKLLNNSIPGWSFQIYPKEEQRMGLSPYIECFLNEDTLHDYALNLVVKKDSIAYFVALLSNGNSFTIYILERERTNNGNYRE